MGAAAGTRWPAGFCRVPGTRNTCWSQHWGPPPAPCQAQGGGGGFRARGIELELKLLGHLLPVTVTVKGAELEPKLGGRPAAVARGARIVFGEREEATE